MNVRPAQGTTADAPFDFWPWLLPADRSRNGHHGGAIELLPAIRHRFPGCVSDGVVSVRLVTVTPDKPVTAWAVQITEFKALPTATQWAYWLLNGDTLHHMQVGEDWAETSNDPADWTMHDLEACLDSAVRSIWRQASQEAFDSA